MVFFCWNVISIGSFHDTMTLKQLPIDFFTKITPSNIKYFFPLFPATNLYHVIICRSTNMLSHGWSPTWSFQEKKIVGITHDDVAVPQRTLYFKKNLPLVQQSPTIFNKYSRCLTPLSKLWVGEITEENGQNFSQKTIFDSTLDRRWYYLCVCNFLSSIFFQKKRYTCGCMLDAHRVKTLV